MRPRGFIERWNPRQKSLDLLKHVEAIIAEYDMALTIRQIFYRLIGRYLYPKTENDYKNLCELLNKARRARLIPMEAIRDDGFVSYYPRAWDSAEHFMASVRRDAEHFRLDRQKGQLRRLVVMCEAGGMALQLFQIANPYGIAVLSAGGFDSTTDKHRLGDHWAQESQPTTVLHIGDYDASGETMFDVLLEDIGAFARSYGGDVEFVRVAITSEQARLRGLPSAPPKPTDHRPRHFTDTETWQAEALDPNDLARILEDTITGRFNRAIYNDVLVQDEIRRALIARLS
jgi:hypothetical protein